MNYADVYGTCCVSNSNVVLRNVRKHFQEKADTVMIFVEVELSKEIPSVSCTFHLQIPVFFPFHSSF